MNLVDLDRWKQKGFYVHVDEKNHVVRPGEIDAKMAAAVLQLAIRIVDATNFVMKDNMARYRQRIKALREKLTEDQHAKIKAEALRLIGPLLSVKGGELSSEEPENRIT